uniref:Uncharacterized protein n=1 Tax=Hucho hucho TaxID=62062 RepID=A0A4W5Q6N1_9TELE
GTDRYRGGNNTVIESRALFTYDGVTNNLKLADSGAGGVVELSGKFHIARPLYGLCRAGSAETGGPRVAMICWVSVIHYNMAL